VGQKKIVVIGLSTDFHINFTLRQWTGRVERAHIIFSHGDWGQPGGGRP